MKRKLDEHDVPTLIDTKDASTKLSNFNSLGLEARLLQAVAQQNFSVPTLVQCKAIPLILEGKDILGTMNWSPEEVHTQWLTPSSSIQDRLRQNCCIHSPNSTINPA